MTEIRPFESRDAAAVAALFQRVFLHRSGPPAPALAERLIDSFLGHPWYDPEIASRVSVAPGGAVDGFIGVYPIRMVLGERPIRAGIASGLMVEDAAADPLKGARLARSFLSGPQDLSLSETANAISAALYERLGGRMLGTYSLDFTRVLRPAGLGLAVLARRIPPFGLAAPAVRAADRVLGRTRLAASFRVEPQGRPAGEGRSVEADAFAAAVIALSAEVRIRPDWEPGTLRWLLEQARVKDRFGPLHLRVVEGPRGGRVGAYALHMKPGQIARVLNVFADPRAAGSVLDDLFAYAHAQGAVAVRGRSDPFLLEALIARRCVFSNQGMALVQSREAAVLEAFRTQPAQITGLAGEIWSPVIGNEFR